MDANKCEYCGMIHTETKCGLVKALEFYPDGSRKRVEFYTPADYVSPPLPSVYHAPAPAYPFPQPTMT